MSKYNCDDCRWHFICGDGKTKCREFELDRICSDSYAEEVASKIKIAHRQYYNEWYAEGAVDD